MSGQGSTLRYVLEWMAEHPILTFLLALVLSDCITAIVMALR